MKHGLVFLVEDPITDLGGEVRCGTACPGQDHQTGNYPVQPLYGADVRVTEDVPAKVRQTAGLIGGEYARGLEHHHKSRVFMDDRKLCHN